MTDDSLAGEAATTIDGLAAGDVETRRTAAEALMLCGESARPAAVALVTAAADADEIVREFAISALEQIGPPLVADRDALVDLAASGESADDTLYWAVTLLARLGPRAIDDRLHGTLMKLCLHESAEVRRRTRWAIRQMA